MLCSPPRPVALRRVANATPVRWILLLPLVCSLFAADRKTVAAENEGTLRERILARYVPRQRRLRETLEIVDQLQAAGRSSEALKTIQWILDQPFDALVIEDRRPAGSVRRLAYSKLRTFPADWKQQYERTYGAEARWLFGEARLRQDDQLAVEVLRRFGETSAAEDAAIWLALRWLDRGEPSLAAAVLIFDADSMADLQTVSSARLLLAQVAADAAGNKQLAENARLELGNRTEPGGNTAEEHASELPARASPPVIADELLTVLDQFQRSVTQDAVPVLRPTWSAKLPCPQSSPHLSAVLDAWRSHLHQEGLAPAIPQLPLVVRDQVLVRDYEGLAGFDFASGKPLWKFPCESNLSAWIDDVARNSQSLADAGSAFTAETLNWWLGSNTQLYNLSSDGIRVYLVDSLVHPASRQIGRPDPFQVHGSDQQRALESNRLLALELPPATSEARSARPNLAWSYGRSLQDHGEKSAGDRYFFGPPTPSAGRLFCLAETDREIRLMALQAETGAVLWEQPLAAADRPAVFDGERAFVACPPIVSEGVILCPTGVGVLAAVDAVTGSLLWSYFDLDLPPDPSRRSAPIVMFRGRTGFASQTIIHGSRVVHLPRSSSSLHCLDLRTGKLLWQPQSRGRACSIAAVTDDAILLLEDQACRAVRLSDGGELWQQSLGPIPGTGISLGSNYLVPLSEGRFAVIDMKTGQRQSWQPPRSGVSLGNLAACGDMVLSTGPDGIAAFPQAQLVRHWLNDPKSKLETAERVALGVDLQIAEGDLKPAERTLAAAVQQPFPAAAQGELKHLFRELLYHRLSEQPETAGPVLAQLKELATTPEERGRFLARQARWAVAAGEMPELEHSLRELSRLPLEVTFPASEDAGWRQSAAACCREMLALADVEHSEFARRFREELLTSSSPRNWRPERLNNWRFVLRVCGGDAAAGPLRSVLAERMLAAGEWHPAELLWWQNRRSESAELAAKAWAGFANLWSQSGWPRDAAVALQHLSQQSAGSRLADDRTLQRLLKHLPRADEVRNWMPKIAQPAGRIASVVISSAENVELPPVENLLPPRSRFYPGDPGRYGDFVRRIGPIGSFSADVLVTAQSRPATMLILDRSISQVVQTVQLPDRYSHPAGGGSAVQGHFVPISAPGEFRGYSLLDLRAGTPVWTRQLPELDGRRTIPAIGPGGPTFLTFQVQNLLFVCDPWDGSILWQRDDLEPGGGLYADARSGLAGDEQCLFVLGADRTGYVLYETLTGREIRRGQLELEARHPRIAFGRKLVTQSQVRGQWHVRVWDPLHDRWELEESQGERSSMTFTAGAPEIGWLTPRGEHGEQPELRTYDVLESRMTLKLKLPDEELEGLNMLKVVVDGDRCYLNLWRNQQTVQTRDYNYQLQGPETILTSIPHVREDFYAIDRSAGKILWKRSLPNRTLLQLDPPGLPFLVFVSHVRDRDDGNLRTHLVEVLDAHTGATIGRQDRLPVDRLINAEYDGEIGTVRLVGQNSTVLMKLLFEPASLPDGVAEVDGVTRRP